MRAFRSERARNACAHSLASPMSCRKLAGNAILFGAQQPYPKHSIYLIMIAELPDMVTPKCADFL